MGFDIAIRKINMNITQSKNFKNNLFYISLDEEKIYNITDEEIKKQALIFGQKYELNDLSEEEIIIKFKRDLGIYTYQDLCENENFYYLDMRYYEKDEELIIAFLW